MLSYKDKEKLKKNWGERAESLDCRAEVKMHDSTRKYECFIYAMNPQDEDDVWCILNTNGYIQLYHCSFVDLIRSFDAQGIELNIDLEYRPRKVTVINKRLMEQYEP